jgi:hypothetical protein
VPHRPRVADGSWAVPDRWRRGGRRSHRAVGKKTVGKKNLRSTRKKMSCGEEKGEMSSRKKKPCGRALPLS